MYGDRWKRGVTLLALLMHQAHHRGQMTVVMRLAGLKVPALYGPAREEWAGSQIGASSDLSPVPPPRSMRPSRARAASA